MKKVIENLADLIKVKTLVTLAVLLVFVVLALNGSIKPAEVMLIISMVISFYFGTQHEKKSEKVTAGTGGAPSETIADNEQPQKATTDTVDTSMYNAMRPHKVKEG